MSSASAAQGLNPRRVPQPLANPTLPVVLRWRDAGSLGDAIRRSMQEPDVPYADGQVAWAGGKAEGLFLAVQTLLGRQPAYVVAVVDQDGRLRFKETLNFSFAAAEPPPAQAQADANTLRRLVRLSALLEEQVVYVADELSVDLDGLRDPLSHALRLRSLAPTLARKAQMAGPAAVQALLNWVVEAFDGRSDPAARARFLLQARDWTPWGAGV